MSLGPRHDFFTWKGQMFKFGFQPHEQTFIVHYMVKTTSMTGGEEDL